MPQFMPLLAASEYLHGTLAPDPCGVRDSVDEFTTPFLPDATKLAVKVGAQKVEAGLSISRGEKCCEWILVLGSRDLIRAAQFGISLLFLVWLAAVDCPSLTLIGTVKPEARWSRLST